MPSISVRASEAASIAATSARDGATVRPSVLHGSIPVSVRAILVRKLLAGWDGKVVSRLGVEPRTRRLRDVPMIRNSTDF
jgi:hypothetical protein